MCSNYRTISLTYYRTHYIHELFPPTLPQPHHCLSVHRHLHRRDGFDRGVGVSATGRGGLRVEHAAVRAGGLGGDDVSGRLCREHDLRRTLERSVWQTGRVSGVSGHLHCRLVVGRDDAHERTAVHVCAGMAGRQSHRAGAGRGRDGARLDGAGGRSVSARTPRHAAWASSPPSIRRAGSSGICTAAS